MRLLIHFALPLLPYVLKHFLSQHKCYLLVQPRLLLIKNKTYAGSEKISPHII